MTMDNVYTRATLLQSSQERKGGGVGDNLGECATFLGVGWQCIMRCAEWKGGRVKKKSNKRCCGEPTEQELKVWWTSQKPAVQWYIGE